MILTLADLVSDIGPAGDPAERWVLVITPDPAGHPDALGSPEPAATAVALSGSRLAVVSNSIDHCYSASHEIAEDLDGWRGHTDEMWSLQANILEHWCRRLAHVRGTHGEG